ASIHADQVVFQWAKFLDFSGQSIEKLKRHEPSLCTCRIFDCRGLLERGSRKCTLLQWVTFRVDRRSLPTRSLGRLCGSGGRVEGDLRFLLAVISASREVRSALWQLTTDNWQLPLRYPLPSPVP